MHWVSSLKIMTSGSLMGATDTFIWQQEVKNANIGKIPIDWVAEGLSLSSTWGPWGMISSFSFRMPNIVNWCLQACLKFIILTKSKFSIYKMMECLELTLNRNSACYGVTIWSPLKYKMKIYQIIAKNLKIIQIDHIALIEFWWNTT